MWIYENSLWKETGFPVFAVVSTRADGNLREAGARESFCRAHGIDSASLVTAEQVHGNNVVIVDRHHAGANVPAADGLLTKEKGLALTIFTADCVPVLFADEARTAAGIVHAGWRGLAGGIIGAAVDLFQREFAVAAGRLHATIGPHIQRCCYTVGAELKAVFHLTENETHLDLAQVAVRQLRAKGIEQITSLGHCTCHEEDMFFSYRRDKTTHRLMSLVRIG